MAALTSYSGAFRASGSEAAGKERSSRMPKKPAKARFTAIGRMLREFTLRLAQISVIVRPDTDTCSAGSPQSFGQLRGQCALDEGDKRLRRK